MKNRQAASFAVVFFCFAIFLGCKTAKPVATSKYFITLTNPSPIERADELVVLSRAEIEQKTGALAAGKFLSITTQNNQPIEVQFDDLDGDSKWDEVVFVCKFEPNQKVVLNISASDSKPGKQEVRAHVRLRKKNDDDSFGPPLDSVTIPAATLPTDFSKQRLPLYVTEGPAWENDKVAFRIYLDNRNAKDIYGKTTPAMMMDTVGANPAENYHTLSHWGMDILASGKSLGAGSLALRIKGANQKDTLVRLAGNNIERTTYKKIADGPVRAVFQLQYTNWTAMVGMSPINITEEISIWGGKYFYQSKVTVSNAPSTAELVTGIVNLKSKKSRELSLTGCKVLYTYDLQSENKDRLGLAVMLNNEQFLSFGKMPDAGSDIVNTYTVSMPLSTRPVVFRFYAGWERSDLLFAHEDSFRRFLQNEAAKFSQPIIVE